MTRTRRRTRRLSIEQLEIRDLLAGDLLAVDDASGAADSFRMLDDHDPSVVLVGSNIITVDEDVRAERGPEWDAYQLLRQGIGDSYITYTFDELPPGTFEVFASWIHYADAGTNVPYMILDGDAELETVRIDQQQAAADAIFEHDGWETPFALLGAFEITNASLSIKVRNDANGWVRTNVIAIQRLSPHAPAAAEAGEDADQTINDTLAEQQVPLPVRILDDRDPSVIVVGNSIITVDEDVRAERGPEWDKYRLLQQGNGDSHVTYPFADLPAATYEVFAAYVHYPDAGTNVPYTILDGDTVLETVHVNQQEAGGDATFEHDGWDTPFVSLGAFEVASGELTVRVSNDTNGWARTNAIAVEQGAVSTTHAQAEVNTDDEQLEAPGTDNVHLSASAFTYPTDTLGWMDLLLRLQDDLRAAIESGADGLDAHLLAISDSRTQLGRAAIGQPRLEVRVEGDTQHLTYWNPLDQSYFVFYWHGGSESMLVDHPGGGNALTLSYDWSRRWPGRNYSTHINLFRDAQQTNGRIGSIPGYVRSLGDMHASVEDIDFFWLPIEAPSNDLLREQVDAAIAALRGSDVAAVELEQAERATSAVELHEMWIDGDTMHLRYSNPGDRTQLAFSNQGRTSHAEVVEHIGGVENALYSYSFGRRSEDPDATELIDAMLYDVADDGTATLAAVVTGRYNETGLTAEIQGPDYLRAGMAVVDVRGPNILVAARTPFENNVLEVQGGGYLNVNRFNAHSVDDLQLKIVTFNADNLSGRYKLSLTDADGGRQVAGAIFLWDKAAGTLTEETEGMKLDDATIEAYRGEFSSMSRQLERQDSLDTLWVSFNSLREIQRLRFYEQSTFFLPESEWDDIERRFPLGPHPDRNGIFHEGLDAWQKGIGELLEFAVQIAVNAWNGESQEAAVDALRERHGIVSGYRYIREFMIDFRMQFPFWRAIRDEGVRIAVEHVQSLHDAQAENVKRHERENFLANQRDPDPEAPVCDQACLHNAIIVAQQHGLDSEQFRRYQATDGPVDYRSLINLLSEDQRLQSIDQVIEELLDRGSDDPRIRALLDARGQDEPTDDVRVALFDAYAQVLSDRITLVGSYDNSPIHAAAPEVIESPLSHSHDACQDEYAPQSQHALFGDVELLAAQAALASYDFCLNHLTVGTGWTEADLALTNGLFTKANGAAMALRGSLASQDVLVIAFRGTSKPESLLPMTTLLPPASVATRVLSSIFSRHTVEAYDFAADLFDDVVLIDRHYDLFEKFEKDVLAYVESQDVDRVIVTGHSLGGAMAQKFMSVTANDRLFQAITFGSPGTLKSVVPEDDRIVNVLHSTDRIIPWAKERGYRRSGIDILVEGGGHSVEDYLDTVLHHHEECS